MPVFDWTNLPEGPPSLDMPSPGIRKGAPWQRTCPHCDADLPPTLAIHPGHCPKPSCRDAHIRAATRVAAARKEVERRHLLERATDRTQSHIKDFAEEQGCEVAAVVVGVTPYQDQPLAPLPPERRAAFVTHVQEIVELAFADPSPPHDHRAGDVELGHAAPESPLLAAACATCQGSCCRLGAGTNAFLRQDTIADLRRSQPLLSATEVIALYTEAIPAESVTGACVYQGPRGCVLDRSVRSETCNRFHCRSQHELLAAQEGREGAPTILVASDDAGDPRAVGTWTGTDGWRLRARLPLI